MRRYFLVILVLTLVAVPLVLAGCVGGSSSASETKSPFEALQDRVSAVESKANSNSSNISSQAGQLRTDLDALSAQLVGLTDGEGVAALADSIDDLSATLDAMEGQIGEIPEPEDPEEEIPTLVELIDDMAALLMLLDARLTLVEAAVDIGNSALVCDPLNVTFLATAGGSNPSPQYLTVDVGTEPTAWVATVNYPVDLPPKQWLFVTPAIGNTDGLISMAVDISTGTALTLGVYYAKITLLTATDVVEVSITLMVSNL